MQNQRDIADWPCFSKFVASFPLGQIPAGKVVVEAAVTLHQFGNAGGGEWGEPPPSYMSASLLEAAIDEETVSWNSTPGVAETGPVVLVQPMSGPVVWPGVAWQWDVSRLLASAYTQGKNSLDLVWYSADAAYHTGKYFTSSETGDWNVAGRPALLVRFADELDDWQLVDFNVNGRVDIFDLSYLIEGWGGLGCEWIVDVTGDCVVDVRDWWRGLEFFGRPY